MKRYIVYSDWACSGNPWPWWRGVVVIENSNIVAKLSWSADYTTNNQMELKWAIEGIMRICDKEKLNIDRSFNLELFNDLNKIKDTQIHLDIYTDSIYVQKWITQYIKKWRINGWRTANKKPVANSDLRVELDILDSYIDIDRHWVKGHDWNQYNELADKLATKYLY